MNNYFAILPKCKRIVTLILILFFPNYVLFNFSPVQAQSSPYAGELLSRVTNAYPAISPDGKKIAYMSNADGDFDIYVMHLSEAVRIQLTDAPGRDGTPVWSPDGSKIAFQSFRDGHSQVYIMNSDGSEQQNISNSLSHDEHPFWSSNGKKILFCSNRPDLEGEDKENIDIFEMNAEGTDVRRITHTPEVETYASWSPNGSKIVCRKILANDDWEIVVMNSDGSNPLNISNHSGIDGWPVWSPDGSKIAFASEYKEHIRIYVMDSNGQNKTRVSDEQPYDDRQPWWYPDGSALLFSRYTWFEGSPWYEASEIFVIEVR